MRHPRSLICLLFTCLAAAAPAAWAGDVATLSGFNAETRPAAGPVVLFLDDGRALLSTGSFGADELSVLQADGSVTLFAEGIGGLAGVAQESATGALVVGDSNSATPLWRLVDLNDDGDALDAGEMVAHPTPWPLVNGEIPVPFSMGFRPGVTPAELYVTTSFFSGAPGAVIRVAGGTSEVFATGGLSFPAGLAWDGDTLYVADSVFDPGSPTFFTGSVTAFRDGNDDGDALDAGEAQLFASGLNGASALRRVADGCFYLSGVTDLGDSSGAIARLLPDDDDDGMSDGIEHVVVSGLGSFAGEMVLVEGAGGLSPGSTGDGALWISEFTTAGPLYAGNVIVRSAPHCATDVIGEVANDSTFEVVVSGEPGAIALAVLSLDASGPTLLDVGDLCVGFAAPHLILPVGPVGADARAGTTVVLHGVAGAVGTEFVAQGFTLQGGDIGIGNALPLVIAP
ncbi:MAG: SMP-30/gluconolactonase/LRE family protein [Planctomycetota bacterium]|jgi:hypothetical protein